MSLNKRLINSSAGGVGVATNVFAYVNDNVANSAYLAYYDLSDPANVTRQSAGIVASQTNKVASIAVDNLNNKIYVGTSTELKSYNSSNPTSLVELDSYAATNIKHIELGSTSQLYFSRYTSSSDNAVEYINVTDPSNMVQVSQATRSTSGYSTFPVVYRPSSNNYVSAMWFLPNEQYGLNLIYSNISFNSGRVNSSTNSTALGRYHDIDPNYNLYYNPGGLFVIAMQGKAVFLAINIFNSGYVVGAASFQFQYILPNTTDYVEAVSCETANQAAYIVTSNQKLIYLEYGTGSLVYVNEITLPKVVNKIIPDYTNNLLYLWYEAVNSTTLQIVNITNRANPVVLYSYDNTDFGNGGSEAIGMSRQL